MDQALLCNARMTWKLSKNLDYPWTEGRVKMELWVGEGKGEYMNFRVLKELNMYLLK